MRPSEVGPILVLVTESSRGPLRRVPSLSPCDRGRTSTGTSRGPIEGRAVFTPGCPAGSRGPLDFSVKSYFLIMIQANEQ